MSELGPEGCQPVLLGVIGWPVGHSLSPVMHNAAFRAEGMDCHYVAFAVPPADLAAALAGIRALGIHGVNVTIPHKEAVIPLLDEVAPSARQMGAVNTIANREGRLVGYNTDGWGFISSLEEAGVKPAGMRAVVLGAGGAARAVAVHLALSGVSRLTISNRTAERAERLAALVRDLVPGTEAEAVASGSEEEAAVLAEADLVVNCTPLGMHPDGVDLTPLPRIDLLPPGAVVYDTVYRPRETRLLREARQRGLRTISGVGMLVHQGACAWEYWFGRRGPVSVMAEAARRALEAME
ncbi:MAG TPA: shikimate dehydrogenase [Symbiobacteriaceae bacterium]